MVYFNVLQSTHLRLALQLHIGALLAAFPEIISCIALSLDSLLDLLPDSFDRHLCDVLKDKGKTGIVSVQK